MLPTQTQQNPMQAVVIPQTSAGGASPEPSFSITNKKTGEHKTVTVTQAHQMGFDDKFINDKLTASSDLRKTIASPDPLSKTDQTRHDALQTALSSLDSAQQNLVQSGGAKGQILGSVALGPLGQVLDPKGAAYHATKIELATQLAKAITGGSRPSGQVIDQYLHSLPDANEDPRFVQDKLDKLYSELTNQAKSFKFQDLVDQYGNTNGSSSDSGQQGGTPPQGNQPPTLLNQAPGFLSKVLGIDDLKKLGNTVNNIPQIMQEGGKEIQQNGAFGKPQPALLKLLGQDPNASPIQNAYNSNGEVQAAAGAVAQPLMAASGIQRLLAGGVEKAGSALGGLLKGGDKSVLQEGMKAVTEGSEARNTAIKTAESAGKTVDGTNLVKGIQEWGQKAIKAGEDVKSVNKQVAQAVKNLDGKVLTPSEAKDLWDTASQGFKDSGKAGNTILSSFQRTLRDGLRSELDNVTGGEFGKGTAKISEGLNKNKILKSVADSTTKTELKSGLKSPLQKILGNPIVRTAGAVAGGGELIRLLQGK